MKRLLLLAAFVLGFSPLLAQKQSPVLGEAELNWPGIHCQIIFLNRIPSDRLLVGVKLLATAKAPPNGTLIGVPVPVPPNPTKQDIISGRYLPRPFSLASSTMIEDLSQQTYNVLPDVIGYRPGSVRAFLKPGENKILTIQFAIPPPPPVVPGQPPAKQTVSFLFTNAKGPIHKIPIPSPTANGADKSGN